MDTGSVVPDILSPSCAALQLQGAVLGQLDKVLIPSEPAPVALVLQSTVQWWTPEGSGCDMLRNKVSTYIHVAKVQIASQRNAAVFSPMSMLPVRRAELPTVAQIDTKQEKGWTSMETNKCLVSSEVKSEI